MSGPTSLSDQPSNGVPATARRASVFFRHPQVTRRLRAPACAAASSLPLPDHGTRRRRSPAASATVAQMSSTTATFCYGSVPRSCSYEMGRRPARFAPALIRRPFPSFPCSRATDPLKPASGPPSAQGRGTSGDPRFAFKAHAPGPTRVDSNALGSLRSLTTRRSARAIGNSALRMHCRRPKVPDCSLLAQPATLAENAAGSTRTPTPIVLDTATLRR